jgi:hypothetical protein
MKLANVDQNFIMQLFRKTLMVLNDVTRGAIENAIDSTVTDANIYTKVLFDPKNKNFLQLKEPNDFVLGVALGTLTLKSQYIFTMINGRIPTIDEIMEISNTLNGALPRIRNAMFELG